MWGRSNKEGAFGKLYKGLILIVEFGVRFTGSSTDLGEVAAVLSRDVIWSVACIKINLNSVESKVRWRCFGN
jgi:hypothetical protein